jgi:TonB-dependent starch-binding outer membrane protein SusC
MTLSGPGQKCKTRGMPTPSSQYVSRNLFTWTSYTGYDPEVNMFGLSTVERGTDFAVYPNPRSFGLGLRLTY